MTNPGVDYNTVCVRPDIAFETYYENLKKLWDTAINKFINSSKCSENIQPIMFLISLFKKIKQYDLAKLDIDINTLDQLNQLNPLDQLSQLDQIAKLNKENLKISEPDEEMQNKLLNIAVDMITDRYDGTFSMSSNVLTTLKDLAIMFKENCECQLIDIVSFIANKYKLKRLKIYQNKTKEEQIQILKNDLENAKNLIKLFTSPKMNNNIENINDNIEDFKGEEFKGGDIMNVSMMSFSLEKELDKLIPNELGSLKDFFVKVIVNYFNESTLHPIIWAQMFRSMMANIFIDLPITPDELFSFMSKHILLNAGPFILKMLQMIRPVLSVEIAKKYNLTKLTYPLMEKNQVDLILRKILNNYDMTKITYNKSASVGHVCIGHDVRNINNKFVIKIIKPLAIAQSCWEYSVLGKLFKDGTCEDSFIKNTLKSNGAEMNVTNEIKNLIEGHEAYTSNYKQEFGIDIDAKLTTIEYLPELEGKKMIKDGTWFAFAMTLAPGIPVADLVENNELMKDTKYRANLHRCLDVLVSRFFYTLISTGFYHGDLHAGNIFYSYKLKQLTMIDFGATGRLEIFKGDDTTLSLIHVIIKSIYYDYGGVLDTLTDILNKRCSDDPKTQIDMKSENYIAFKKELVGYEIKNTLNYEEDSVNYNKYIGTFNSDKRINDEKEYTKKVLQSVDLNNATKQDENKDESIYDYLEQVSDQKETIIENRDDLPVYKEMLGESNSVTFAKIMEMIIKFYASSGINVAIKFAELNEIQKAYALLLGVLAKTGYNSYRMSLAIKTGVLTWGHLPKITNVTTAYNLIKYYWNESSRYEERKQKIIDSMKNFKVSKRENIINFHKYK
jgi:hypothetical protein